MTNPLPTGQFTPRSVQSFTTDLQLLIICVRADWHVDRIKDHHANQQTNKAQVTAAIQIARTVNMANKHIVRSYYTDEALEGRPSKGLIRESLNESSGTGAVLAYLDDREIWLYVSADRADFVRNTLGEEVVTVWVDE